MPKSETAQTAMSAIPITRKPIPRSSQVLPHSNPLSFPPRGPV
jgi:hypothetical protein